jgi:hypothetical protein
MKKHEYYLKRKRHNYDNKRHFVENETEIMRHVFKIQ